MSAHVPPRITRFFQKRTQDPVKDAVQEWNKVMEKSARAKGEPPRSEPPVRVARISSAATPPEEKTRPAVQFTSPAPLGPPLGLPLGLPGALPIVYAGSPPRTLPGALPPAEKTWGKLRLPLSAVSSEDSDPYKVWEKKHLRLVAADRAPSPPAKMRMSLRRGHAKTLVPPPPSDAPSPYDATIIESCLKNTRVLRTLGKGSFGTVYELGYDCDVNGKCERKTAIKVQADSRAKSVKEENDIQQRVHQWDPLLAAKILSSQTCVDKVLTETELYDGDMKQLGRKQFKYLASKDMFPYVLPKETGRRRYFFTNPQLQTMVQALYDLGNKLHVVHADDKPHNILYRLERFEPPFRLTALVISDFGNAGSFDKHLKMREPHEGFTNNKSNHCDSLHYVRDDIAVDWGAYNVWQFAYVVGYLSETYAGDFVEKPDGSGYMLISRRFWRVRDFVPRWMLTPAQHKLFQTDCAREYKESDGDDDFSSVDRVESRSL